MGSIWIASCWSAAVLPAWLLVDAVRPRLEAIGQVAPVIGLVVAWYLCGSILAGAARLVLPLLGIDPEGRPDPEAELARTRKGLARGGIERTEGELRAAACLVALQRFDEALEAVGRAEDAGARESRRAESRWLRARSLEGVGRPADAGSVYAALEDDPGAPPVVRAGAMLRAVGLTAGGEVPDADALLGRWRALWSGPGCKPCSRAGATTEGATDRLFLAEAAGAAAGRSAAHGKALGPVVEDLVGRAAGGREADALREAIRVAGRVASAGSGRST